MTAEAVAWIERQEADLRRLLATRRVAAERFVGSLYGEDGDLRSDRPFVVEAGQRLPGDHPIVAAFPDRFRAMSPEEIEAAVKSARRGWEYELGL